ncbi:amidase [Paenibacillus radicis (ex Gao et al. 2016)]|uniref:Amidase n=1 Tax=Paenibacillus radicis (ex Gao et al. 2016) TaxID=1737354 RepID=A0A917LVA8_9BACL|nr:amidase [Paenibacillus radicis (ex Gao et al. 2016)]GGG60409.1 amidase [Paenibacillus radicis (ex Gao et al. 2016)]
MVQWTIASAGRAFRDGSLSPVALLDLLLGRISQDEPRYRTFITVMAEEARTQALQAEKELESGFDRGPLHGIPISVKDLIRYAGVPLSNGSGRKSPFIPDTHAYLVEQLLEVGAVIIGKSHLHEFAYGKHHPAYGAVQNPYDIGRLPGGSSSGSAAGVAAGFALGSIGTDTAGSVRVPASFCGTAGFKPTPGRISLEGITPLAPSLDHAGVITLNAEDAALLFQVLDSGSGHAKQQHAVVQPRFGVSLAYLEVTTEPEVRDAIQNAVHALELQGASVQWLDTEVPIQDIKEKTWTILHYEAHATHRNLLQDWTEGYSEPLRSNLRTGEAVTDKEYMDCLTWRDSAVHIIDHLFADIDVLITPTCPVTAGPIDALIPGRPANGEFTPLANLWGLPALTLPIGLSQEGIPIGMQLTGRREADWHVLDAGIYVENLLCEI